MLFGILGGKSLFTPLDMALKGADTTVTISPLLKVTLEDWRVMIWYMAKYPTLITHLVPATPDVVSFTDACSLGTGGVWFGHHSKLHPFLWQVQWPQDVQENIVMVENLQASITINDLELAGALLGILALENQGSLLVSKHLATFCNNMSTVAWVYKMRNSTSIQASHLLKFMGLKLHQLQTSSLVTKHIAGEHNKMANIISRAFKDGKYFHVSQNLISFFNSNFTLPQKESWKKCQPTTRQISSVIACLCGKRLPMESLLVQQQKDKNIGNTGWITPVIQGYTLSSNPTQSCHSKGTSLQEHLLHKSVQERLVWGNRYAYWESLTPLLLSSRPSNWLENAARSTEEKTNTNCSLKG